MSPPPSLPQIAVDEMAACNRLLAEAFSGGAEAVVLTTSRSLVSQQVLDELHRVHMAHPAAVAGCRVMDPSHTTHFLLPGWRWSALHFEWRLEWCIEIKPDPTGPTLMSCDWLNPDVLLIPRTAWNAAGPFDPSLAPQLAAIDWCLRARKGGIKCFEVQTAVAFKQPSSAKHKGPWGTTHLPDLPGMLILAGKHQLPMGRRRLAWQFMHKAVSEELGRVRYWADYDFRLSTPKRTVWYLRNLILALKRARIPSLVLSVLWGYLSTSMGRSTR